MRNGLKYVLGVDPGKKTGIAMWEAMPGHLAYTAELDQIDFCSWADRFLSVPGGGKGSIIVACESYTMGTAVRSPAPWSLEVIGTLRYLCHKHEQHFRLQTPVDAKNFASNDKLKLAGFYVVGQEHARDAARHLLLALVQLGLIELETLVR